MSFLLLLFVFYLINAIAANKTFTTYHEKIFFLSYFPLVSHRKIPGFPVSTETYRIKKMKNKSSISFLDYTK